jgi:hypothetical protein
MPQPVRRCCRDNSMRRARLRDMLALTIRYRLSCPADAELEISAYSTSMPPVHREVARGILARLPGAVTDASATDGNPSTSLQVLGDGGSNSTLQGLGDPVSNASSSLPFVSAFWDLGRSFPIARVDVLSRGRFDNCSTVWCVGGTRTQLHGPGCNTQRGRLSPLSLLCCRPEATGTPESVPRSVTVHPLRPHCGFCRNSDGGVYKAYSRCGLEANISIGQ